MSTPINLNKVRKTKARAARKARADENAVAFGRTRLEKQAEKQRQEKTVRDLNGHKRDP